MDLQETIDRLLNDNKKDIDTNKIEEFTECISDLINIKNYYTDKLPELKSLAEKETVRFEYSKGGLTIHRGFYCPSPVYDLIVGNCKRGRLLKKKPDFPKYTYEYSFDKDNNLMRASKINELATQNNQYNEEFLIYNNNIVYGMEFGNRGEIDVVSRCTYNKENIIAYERSLCTIDEYADLHYEKYKYENDVLSEVTVFFGVVPQFGLYTESKYLLERDENGKVVRLIGGEVINNNWNKRGYDIK
jgi:hypothetical protein